MRRLAHTHSERDTHTHTHTSHTHIRTARSDRLCSCYAAAARGGRGGRLAAGRPRSLPPPPPPPPSSPPSSHGTTADKSLHAWRATQRGSVAAANRRLGPARSQAQWPASSRLWVLSVAAGRASAATPVRAPPGAVGARRSLRRDGRARRPSPPHLPLLPFTTVPPRHSDSPGTLQGAASARRAARRHDASGPTLGPLSTPLELHSRRCAGIVLPPPLSIHSPSFALLPHSPPNRGHTLDMMFSSSGGIEPEAHGGWHDADTSVGRRRGSGQARRPCGRRSRPLATPEQQHVFFLAFWGARLIRRARVLRGSGIA